MMSRKKNKQGTYKESLLAKIPILGYLFRKIKEYREPVETTLKTGKAVDTEVEKSSFLGGLITIISGKTFSALRLRRRK